MSIAVHRLAPGDADALAAFYNGFSEASKRTFHPLGGSTTPERCADIIADNREPSAKKYDLVAMDAKCIVGWGFLWGLDADAPTFGLAVADAHQGSGLGGMLMDRVLEFASARGIGAVSLTVVQDNDKARAMYARRGFVQLDAFVGEDGLPYFRMRAQLPTAQSPP